MPFVTVQDIISFSLKAAGVLGVGQSALAEDNNDAFTALNGMLSIWQRKRWLIWHLTDNALVSTGAQSYSVGIGGNFNVMRPDRLEAAFFRQFINGTGPTQTQTQTGDFTTDFDPTDFSTSGGGPPAGQPNQVDYPLEILESREDYNRIVLKTLPSLPRYIFYDADYPWGFVYPWPVPQAGVYEIHLTLKETLNQFTSLNQSIALPPEYEEALWTNLSIRLAPIYQFTVRPEVLGLAKAALATIRGANTQIPRLRMPTYLNRPSLYDANSDRMY
jgi:hypothetical protein